MRLHPSAFAAIAALAFFTLPAHAVGRLADVTVVDRQSGATLPLHYHRGEYWVAGQPGARYAVSVRNRLGERILAVPSVDGVNVLSGETASWEQTGYVFSPYRGYQISGWRKSNSEIAAFEFSSAGDSYAGRTGRPDHLGVIGVALFREKATEPVIVAPPVQPWPGRDLSRQDESGARQRSAPLPARAPVAPAAANAESSAQPQAASPFSDNAAKSAAAPSLSPRLGTGHGQREVSMVSHTAFTRLQAQPNEIIRIRYDSRENLVAMGVIREPVAYPRTPVPDAFPQSGNASYVPDPPVRRY